MPNVNIKIDEDLLWRFRQLKIKFKTDNNTELLKKLVELAEYEKIR